jgi:hypothetical protein
MSKLGFVEAVTSINNKVAVMIRGLCSRLEFAEDSYFGRSRGIMNPGPARLTQEREARGCKRQEEVEGFA